MKSLVVYDSVYGNTEKIAQAIAAGLKEKGEVRLVKAGSATTGDLKGIGLLVVGAPTQGGRPTPPVLDFLKKITADDLKNVKTAVFDTRIKKGGTGVFAKIFGYAANRIESELKKMGANVVAAEGFGVKGKAGPLDEGEVERARGWGRELASR
jgi:flavodoxin